MIKRILSLILLMTTGLALCACPGGAPVEPPVGNCPSCGKNPCECPTGNPCPDCGNDPCTCKPADPSQPIGKDVTVTPDKADLSIVFGDGAAVTGAHIQPFAAGFQKAKFDQVAAVCFAARVPQHHLSSRAFSTESTLPSANSSGT